MARYTVYLLVFLLIGMTHSVFASRLLLTTDSTVNVRTDGSDANDGSANDAAHAMLTLQGAVNLIYGTIDTGGHNIKIKLADGAYNGNTIIRGYHVGGGKLIIEGNTTTPGNVVLDAPFSQESISTLWVIENAVVHMQGLKLQATDAQALNNAIRATYGGRVVLDGGIEFGPTSWAHMLAGADGSFVINAGYTITAGAKYHHFMSSNTTLVSNSGITVTLINAPHFSGAFYAGQRGSNAQIQMDYSGAATGKRFDLATGSQVDNTPTHSGLDYFPGDVAGTNESGIYADMVGEERSWTPTLVGATTAGTQTYTVQLGHYIRYGNIVIVWFRIVVAGIDPAASGIATIAGLPFASSNITNLNFTGAVGPIGGVAHQAGYNQWSGSVVTGSNTLRLQEMGDNVPPQNAPITNVHPGAVIVGQITYRIN